MVESIKFILFYTQIIVAFLCFHANLHCTGEENMHLKC